MFMGVFESMCVCECVCASAWVCASARVQVRVCECVGVCKCACPSARARKVGFNTKRLTTGSICQVSTMSFVLLRKCWPAILNLNSLASKNDFFSWLAQKDMLKRFGR